MLTNGKIGEPRLVALPALDQIMRNPALVETLPADLAGKLLVQIKTVEGALLARLLVRGADAAHDRMLNADDIARELKVSRRWVFRNLDKLPFVHRHSRTAVECSEQDLQDWRDAHKTKKA